MLKIRKRVKKIFFFKKKYIYLVGNYKINLPIDHPLKSYQNKYKNYDKKIGSIITHLEKNERNGIIIDIGANIGDTAALLRTYSSSDIWCVEGEEYFLKYLKLNAKIIPNLKIIEAFVSGHDNKSNLKIIRKNGTAQLIEANDTTNKMKFISLNEIFKIINLDNKKINLIKIDTDGFDLDILFENLELIEKYKPSLFFEYNINYYHNGFKYSLEVMNSLENIGYKFIVYDNFGNLMDFHLNNSYNNFLKHNHYLQSSLENGGGIYYYDIFASTNINIIKSIINEELKSYENTILKEIY
ncbi:FkbM family methyltransferase [Porphyromonadaceae sp. NP-X]|nr:FkbM family methyltransferase [Porphyromonadaceae sp. NP-X]